MHLPAVRLDRLTSQIKKQDAQLILFAGDIVDTFDETLWREFLENFAQLPQQKLLVLGNHDLWQEEQPNTKELYDYYLKFPWRKYGFHLLDKEPFVYKGIAFCGNMGWYDYSLRLPNSFDLPIIANDDLLCWESMSNEEIHALLQTAVTKSFQDLTEDDFARKILLVKNQQQWESLHWYDRLYINWGKSDQEMTKFFLERLERQLKQTKGLQQVVVLHHAPLLPRRKAESVMDAYLSVFNGSRQFGDLIRTYQVKTVIHGHLHQRYDFVEQCTRVYSCYGEPCAIEIKDQIY